MIARPAFAFCFGVLVGMLIGAGLVLGLLNPYVKIPADRDLTNLSDEFRTASIHHARQ